MPIQWIKSILKKSPIALSKNHRYDLQTKKIIRRIPPYANCIDVGCYKGEILDFILKIAPEGNHFGIEPIPTQYQYLVKKYLHYSNCKIFNIAASNKKSISQFNYVISNPSYSGLKKRDYDRPNEKEKTIEVYTDLLDDVIPENLPIHLIKIDVEGAELLVMKGATQILTRNKPIIIFEHGLGASNHYKTTPDQVYDFLDQHGYKIYTLTNYLNQRDHLGKIEFQQQYFRLLNYYFVAIPDVNSNRHS